MSNFLKINFISILFIVCITLINGDNQSKVTSKTVTTSSLANSLLNVYKPRSDVIYSEPNLEEQQKSKIELIKKETDQIDKNRRPTQFSSLIKNQQLLDKQKAAINLPNGRLNARLLNDEEDQRFSRPFQTKQFNKSLSIKKRLNDRHELNNQFAQSLNYLIKYINRQGQTLLANGTQPTKDANNILLKHARNLDRDNCLLRLICEIASNQEDASDNQLIKEIRIVFGKKHRAPAYPTKQDSSFPFFYAGHIGSASNNAERCLQVFPVCSASTEELLQIVSNANKFSKLNPAKLNLKNDKMIANSKLERELNPTSESREFSEKMRNKMKKIHKQYIKRLN